MTTSGYERLPRDAYRSPGWVIEPLLANFQFIGPIWECAAGDGDLVEPLKAAFRSVVATDINHGYDFLLAKNMRRSSRTIITNPPYSQSDAFVSKALDLTRECEGAVAMLFYNQWDCAGKRKTILRDHPAYQGKLVLTRRLYLPGLVHRNSPRQNHAWFVWNWTKTRPHGYLPHIWYE